MRSAWAPLGMGALLAAIVAPLALGARAAPAPPEPTEAIRREPRAILFSPDGDTAYVTEAASGTVAVVAATQRQVVARLETGGEEPTGLALSPDGRTLAVTNTFSGSVAVFDTAARQRVRLVPLRGMPWGIAIAPDGRTAYVAVSQLDRVVRLDLATGAVTASVAVGRRPRAVALAPGGETLVVGNFASGEVSLIEVATLRERARVPMGGVNLRGLALTRDGSEAFVTLQPPLNGRPTSYPLDVWNNFVRACSVSDGTVLRQEQQWLDFLAVGCADLDGIVLNGAGRWAWIAVGGRDSVARISIHDPLRVPPNGPVWPNHFAEARVGANPRGIALRPGEREVWVACALADEIAIVDAERMQPLATLRLGAHRSDPALAGRRLFHSAALTSGGRFSCNSCHPEGGSDGLTWRFVHVEDAIERRNTRDLRGGIAETAPFRWSGHDARLDDFLRDEITGLLRGPAPDAEQLAALRAALATFRLPPNPHRQEDGSLTPAARRGEALFVGKAQCATCHAGPRRGGNGRQAWIGTTPAGVLLDVPHLTGVYDSPPYLHDGRAATLEEIFTRHDPERLHGNVVTLTPDEFADLLAFVREQ